MQIGRGSLGIVRKLVNRSHACPSRHSSMAASWLSQMTRFSDRISIFVSSAYCSRSRIELVGCR